jgi:hypothetical protein
VILLSTDDTPTQQLLNEEIPRQFLDQASREGVTEVGDWQALDVSDKPQGRTIELRNAIFEYHIPKTKRELEFDIRPNMPFAEAQFQDRVSGQPLNPPPSFDLWPWRVRGEEHQGEQGTFSHSYPERLWPKEAGDWKPWDLIDPLPEDHGYPHGLRGRYGDLWDAVQLLKRPGTRQCFIPIWYPEDLAAAAEKRVRVPCSIGYWVVERDNKLHMTYLIRSVDFLRHARDDIYLASRLCQWLVEHLDSDAIEGLVPGTLTMWMGSFHVFEGDLPMMRRRLGG